MKRSKQEPDLEQIEHYCSGHKGADKVHCFDNGCKFCREEIKPLGVKYACQLRELAY